MAKRPQEPVYLIINESTGDRKQIYEDDVRMAVGFLDTSRLMDVAPFKSFVAIVKMTRSQIHNQRKFSFPVKDLMQELGIDHHNYDKLDASIDALMSTILDFNVHKHDNNPGWDKAQILGP
ncbi:MAG: RepB family plasmid replication initiator protein, partial [Polynucleobacter sp.]|nr:RepB family plasmid replication initiator protein [Polynucleobacter sp.]